ncbi:MAG: SUMF1/EgtB/PvdO family nonheme iron enzyme [Caldilineaceae bacterium]
MATNAPKPGELLTNPLPARRYAWGDTIDADKLNYNETNIGSTSAVGAFPAGASPYGVEELNGNVLEWCSTKAYPEYSQYTQTADDSLAEDTRRVLRGSVCCGAARLAIMTSARAAFRSGFNPHFRNLNVGVRILLSPLPRESVPRTSEL